MEFQSVEEERDYYRSQYKRLRLTLACVCLFVVGVYFGLALPELRKWQNGLPGSHHG